MSCFLPFNSGSSGGSLQLERAQVASRAALSLWDGPDSGGVHPLRRHTILPSRGMPPTNLLSDADVHQRPPICVITSRVLSLLAAIMSAILLVNLDSFIASLVIQMPTHIGDSSFRPEFTTKQLIKSYFSPSYNVTHNVAVGNTQETQSHRLPLTYSTALRAINKFFLASPLNTTEKVVTAAVPVINATTTPVPTRREVLDDSFWDLEERDKSDDGGVLDGSSYDSSDFRDVMSLSSYSFTVSGRFVSVALPTALDNTTTEHRAAFLADWERGFVLDEGSVRAVLLTRQSAVSSIRLASVRVVFESTRFPGKRRQIVTMSGLDLRDVSALTFQGTATGASLGLPLLQPAFWKGKVSSATVDEKEDPRVRQCSLLATLTFNRFPLDSVSVRPVDVQRDGTGEGWGFDDAVLGEGGTWDNRQLAEQQSDELADAERVRRIDESNPFKGVIVSPDCGVRIIISADEVDLVALGARVVHFAFFFVLKCLLEVRFFLAQVRYTDTAASSPLKVSILSLGLHTCVDCFEAILLLTQAISANFMTSTFVVLAIFKMMFVSVVELRYLVIVLKARYVDTAIKLVKLHALGTAFVLIATLKMMPIFPAAVVLLFLFWVPQIIFDVWKGHSLLYVLGISACRVFLPIYVWGCPSPIFDGVIFKSLPGAPSWWLALFITALLVVAVLAQHFLGPRCFVPLVLLPNVYNYYRPVPKVPPDLEGRFECVICMTEISYVSKTLVTTPCDHRFHETCLQQWMDVKPECPTCRGPLPPFP